MDAGTGPRWVKKNTRTCKLTTKELEEKLSHVLPDEQEEESSQSENNPGKKKNATSRSSSKRIAPVLGKFSDAKKTLLQQIGFEDSVHIPGINKMDRAYTVDLMMSIDCDTHELHIDATTKIKLTDQDVKRLFSLPRGPNKVCGIDSDEPEDTLDFIRLYIGTGAVEAYNSLEAAEHNVTKEYSHAITEEEAHQFQVSFVVWMMNRFYAPSSQPNTGSKTFWGALMKADEIAGYNWCGFVLDNTIEAARKAQYDMAAKKSVANVGGCPLFLQVLALEFIRNDGREAPPRLLPVVADYDSEMLGKLIQVHRKRIADNLHKSTQDPGIGEFYQAVDRAKMDIKMKIAVKCHMAKLLKLNSQERAALIRNGIALVENLSGAMSQQGGAFSVTPKDFTEAKNVAGEGYASGGESATDGSRDSNNRSKRKMSFGGYNTPGPSYSKKVLAKPVGTVKEIPLSTRRGLEAFDTPVNSKQSATLIDGPSFDAITLGLDDIEMPNLNDVPLPTTCNREVQPVEQETYPNTKPCSPNTSFSQEMIAEHAQDKPVDMAVGIGSIQTNAMDHKEGPVSIHHKENEVQGGLGFNTPANTLKAGTTPSSGSLTRLFSETAIVYRLLESEETFNLNGRSLADEFTESPIVKKNCPPVSLAKSPWSQGLSHPRREPALTSKFAEWLNGATGPDIERLWIMHDSHRYVEVRGTDLKEVFCRKAAMTYDIFDIAIRRLVELDDAMYTNKEDRRWRHIMESNFAMLALAGMSTTDNRSIRDQFIGKDVKLAIQACRMITVPALVRETWCAYSWDMKLKRVHVLDPLFKSCESAFFQEIHAPNVKVLKEALTACAIMFFDGWCPQWDQWDPCYIAPPSPGAQNHESGVRTLRAVRDFNGSTFVVESNEPSAKELNEWMLHEVLCLSGNSAKLPGQFIQSVDD